VRIIEMKSRLQEVEDGFSGAIGRGSGVSSRWGMKCAPLKATGNNAHGVSVFLLNATLFRCLLYGVDGRDKGCFA
jgi:hypothetical protein